jgi:ABC-2 type transport system permease protein
LTFFPDWLRLTAEWLPFQGIVFVPTAIYLGHLSMMQSIHAVALQAGWVAALWWAGRLGWHWAVRKVTIHGG